MATVKQVEAPKVVFDAFGHSRPLHGSEACLVDCTPKNSPLYDLEIDENHAAHLKESGEVSLYDQIQSYKDSCGMDYAKRLLMTGQAIPGQFADDGSCEFEGNMEEDIVDIGMRMKAAKDAGDVSEAALYAQGLRLPKQARAEEYDQALDSFLKNKIDSLLNEKVNKNDQQ